ncbi:MAG: hypothetical protein GY839_14210 [candidate division Zixibacteria bacterium]|nr:hypothetical protein [candidate division Zixibacteria bacterium]
MADQKFYKKSIELREIDDESLITILEYHFQWHTTNGKKGQQADLSYTDLKGMDLGGAFLYNSNLRGSDLTNAKGIVSGHLGGANIARTTLPEEIREFSGLKYAEDISKNTRVIFNLLILACIYSILTIIITTDANLILNNVPTKLPIINMLVPVRYFYWLMPIFLLIIYIYQHLHLQRLWETLAMLPALFQDGKPLDKKVFPWFPNNLVRAFFPLLKRKKPVFSKLQTSIIIFILWFPTPITIMLFWIRYLTISSWPLTIFHILILSISIAFGYLSLRMAITILKINDWRPIKLKSFYRDKRFINRLVILFWGIIILLIFSYGTINGINHTYYGFYGKLTTWVYDDLKDVLRYDARIIVPRLYKFCGLQPFINLKNTYLSLTTDEMTENPIIREIDLSNKNLRYADISFCTINHTIFYSSDLTGVNFSNSNLQYSNFSDAKLFMTSLNRADLRNTKFEGTNISYSFFNEADLRECEMSFTEISNSYFDSADFRNSDLHFLDFKNSKLINVNFMGANLESVNLKNADIRDINVQDANLRYIRGLNNDKRYFVKNIVLAYLDEEFLDSLGLPKDHNERLKRKDFRNYKLFSVNCQEANLIKANFQDADLLCTDFRGADLSHSNFKNANLSSVHLQGANLSNAIGLSIAQLSKAFIDENTIFPEYLADSIYTLY